MEDRRYHGMADNTFFLDTTTEMTGEGEATVTAGGDGTALQLGPWGEVHLHRTLSFLMMAVGPSRLDLAEAAFGHLQPPPVGQDWEQLLHLSANIITYTPTNHDITFDGYHGLLATNLPAKGFGLDMEALPVSLTNTVLVSLGEGKIVGTDVRRPGLPLYISPLRS